MAKVRKSHDGGIFDPEHHVECDPEHPDESKLKIWKSDETKQAMYESRNSRCVRDEFSKVAHTGKRWSDHNAGDCDAELVTAVLKGLKQQLQDDGLLSTNAFEPGMTGHELQTWDENHIEQFFDELTGVPLDPEQVKTCKDQGG